MAEIVFSILYLFHSTLIVQKKGKLQNTFSQTYFKHAEDVYRTACGEQDGIFFIGIVAARFPVARRSQSVSWLT